MRILLISGGSLCASAADYIQAFDPEWVIAADAGIHHALTLGIHMDQILGDFDSVSPEDLACCDGIDRIEFPAEKDYTDTELALETAMERAGSRGKILMLAAMGTRADHSLANIFLLKKAADAGIDCEIVDDYNRVRLLRGPVSYTVRFSEAEGITTYVSLLPVFGDARDITLRGMKYPLDHAVIPSGRAWGVSNELVAPEGHIQLQEGYVLLILAGDQAHGYKL